MERISILMRAFIFIGLWFAASLPTLAAYIEEGVGRDMAKERKANVSDVVYRLHFDIPDDRRRPVTGRVSLSFTWSGAERDDLPLDFQGKVSSLLAVNDRRVAADYSHEHIIIPAKMLNKGKNVVELSFTSEDKSLNRNDDYLYTLFVPDHARSVFPCFDQPDLKARFSLTLQLPQGWTAISNAKGSHDGGLFTFNPTEPLPTYLFSFTAGRFSQCTDTCNGMAVTILHRETDPDKTAQLPTVFKAIDLSLRWLETYTAIPCPFQKYDCVILPGYQFGGMEHPGCIQFSDAVIFLGNSPTPVEEMNRLNLLAHETAHLWFGDLVTMEWFDDVWTKEVYANFLADKISVEQFPCIDHDLCFLKTHYIPALATDRTPGTHPIQQPLANLKDAGLLYGNIVYHKAPIMMRKLEERMGADNLREGLRTYLKRYSYANASWDDLVSILDQQTPEANLIEFDRQWVKSKGVKVVEMDGATVNSDCFEYVRHLYGKEHIAQLLHCWRGKSDVQRLSLFITFYENFIAKRLSAADFAATLVDALADETNSLVAASLCDYLSVCMKYADDELRGSVESDAERLMRSHQLLSVRQTLCRALCRQARSEDVLRRVYSLWSEQTDSSLNERDYMSMAYHLAIMMPDKWKDIVATQRARLSSDDRRREFDFISRGCDPDTAAQARLFNELLLRENRAIEPYASSLLALLNDGSREPASNRFITPGLEILQEVQLTGDIFFPLSWCNALLGGHRSIEASSLVQAFLNSHPDYPSALRSKILQAAYLLSQLAE